MEISQRAADKLAELREAHPWAAADTTTVVTTEGRNTRWWTFAGWKANLWLARLAGDFRTAVAAVDDLTIALDRSATAADVAALVDAAVPDRIDLAPWVTSEAVDGLKFAQCLPAALARQVVTSRLADPASLRAALHERVAGFSGHA